MASTTRIVLITGANSGVGLASTKVLLTASRPYHIIMTGRSLPKLHSAMSSLTSPSSEIHNTLSVLQLDVTSNTSIAAAVAAVETQHGRLDALINNAAIGCMDDDIRTRMHASMETNVVGPAVVAEAFRPLLMKSLQAPYSVFVTSGAGSLTRASAKDAPKYKGIKNGEAYGVSKAALNFLAIQEHKTYGPQGLKVFAMCPGFVVSNLRGTSEEARTGWGGAGDPMVAGQTLLAILEGKRDADVGGFVHKDGVYPW